MQVREVTNKDIWEDFLLNISEKTFLDSWNWGEFQKKQGEKIWRLGIYDNEQLIGVTLVIKVKAKRGTFLFVPHGPILRKSDRVTFSEKGLGHLIADLKEIAKQEKAGFIRIASIWERNKENIKIFKDLGFKNAPTHMHPEASWKLDLEPSEEELMRNMRKTTRYLIRQAQKNKDIEIIQSQKLEDIDIFNEIHKEVVKKHHFVPFSLEYFKKEFLAFTEDNKISLFMAKYKGEIIASTFIIFWSNMSFYHHAALSLKYPKIPVAYLLQWEAIKEAKKRGCLIHDFWGYVDPKSRHPWAGPTLFKMGFGGYAKEYVKTQDLILSPSYYLTYIIEKIRKLKRRL